MTHDRGVDLGRGGLSFCILQDPSAPLCFTLSAGVLFPQVSEWFIHSRPSSPASNMSFPDLHSQPPTQSHTHTPHTCICIHTDVHRERHTYMSHMHTHTCTHTHAHICTHRETHVHTYMCIHTWKHSNVYMHTQRDTSTHVCIHKHIYIYTHSVQFSSIAQSCLTLCDPMDCSTPGLPIHHQLPEFTQTHVR